MWSEPDAISIDVHHIVCDLVSVRRVYGASNKDVLAQGGGGYHSGDMGEEVKVNKDIPETQTFFN